MKKPYIKKITTVSKFNVYFVDGEYVRDRLSEEFTDFGQHFRFRFIPKNEFWIDRERTPDEEKFFVDHMLVENRLMAEGWPYFKAHRSASHIEYHCRHHPGELEKTLKEEIEKNRPIHSSGKGVTR